MNPPLGSANVILIEYYPAWEFYTGLKEKVLTMSVVRGTEIKFKILAGTVWEYFTTQFSGSEYKGTVNYALFPTYTF